MREKGVIIFKKMLIILYESCFEAAYYNIFLGNSVFALDYEGSVAFD